MVGKEGSKMESRIKQNTKKLSTFDSNPYVSVIFLIPPFFHMVIGFITRQFYLCFQSPPVSLHWPQKLANRW